jgi:gliding motility associated protien GldN
MSIFRKYGIAAILAVMAAGNTAQAQDPATAGNNNEFVTASWQPSLVRDGAIDRVAHVGSISPWQSLREADVMWKKRVWREIDTREKQNLPFRYVGDDQTGGGTFIEILIHAVKTGKIKAYSTFGGDRFTQAYTKDQIMEMLVGAPDTIVSIDPVTEKETVTISNRDFNPDLVTKYRIKEDWIIDRNLGRMVVRIIGIAPMRDKLNDDGSYRTTYPMMWLYYPELRPVLAQYEVYNPDNDIQRLTWDDFMEGRFWSGRIIQTSNAFGDGTFQNAGYTNMEALYEGQRVQEKLMEKEQDMWVY